VIGSSLVIALAALNARAAASKGNKNPGVLPPNSSPYGQTYGEWSAKWWQRFISLPADHNAFTNTADCAADQSGHVWFLVGGVGGDCTVPADTALFFPILNWECSTVEPYPFNGTDEPSLRACAAAGMDATAGMFCKIDGVAVQNLNKYRVQSNRFTLTSGTRH